MLELLTEKQSIWDNLKKSDKPIYLYGMGDGAEKAMAALSRCGLLPAGVFASDGFVRGHSFKGYRVESFSDVAARHGKDFVALLCFAVDYEPMLSYLYSLGEKCDFYAPDLPVVVQGEQVFDMDFFSEHEAELDFVYGRLADEKSKQVFLDILNYKLSGRVKYLKAASTEKSEVYNMLIKPTDCEIYADLGGYNGDTVKEFLSYAKSAEKIYAMEPDPKNYAKLLKTGEELGIAPIFTAINSAAWSKEATLPFKGGKGGRNPSLCKKGDKTVAANSLDNVLSGERATLIKYDVEGAEAEAIAGSANTIKQYSPSLMVSAYHKNEDIFALPMQVLAINNSYKIYLRHHPYIPAWETNYYFVKS